MKHKGETVGFHLPISTALMSPCIKIDMDYFSSRLDCITLFLFQPLREKMCEQSCTCTSQ